MKLKQIRHLCPIFHQVSPGLPRDRLIRQKPREKGQGKQAQVMQILQLADKNKKITINIFKKIEKKMKKQIK